MSPSDSTSTSVIGAMATAVPGMRPIATGVSVTSLKGREGAVLARTFVHSIVLTLVLVVIVILQQYVVPGIIPAFTAVK